MNIAALIVAAGASSRMGDGKKKEYHPLLGQHDLCVKHDRNSVLTGEGQPLTVLGTVFSVFAENPRISIIVVVHPVKAEIGEQAARGAIGEALIKRCNKELHFVPGGENRRLSVYHGLSLLAAFKTDYVLIHDGARPWLDQTLVNRVIDEVIEREAVIPVIPFTETPKELDAGGHIKRHLKRANLALAQTPQAFLFDKILKAHQKAAEIVPQGNTEWTDDAEIYDEFIGEVAVVQGDSRNKKITFPEDL
ncbi:MAG: 2-C-methyl-D-erythritol 4-phosphate cytidylyltransferase [Spirochaetaceae bacterium]|jgi:2-C-methyl-D-erythritol 4-phosphate cytidylyltransferase|nr:2-C-methyl-D-erythritol 4-phosphate cytidylyltransferase [Spirochaetaceae bacterium]